MNKRLVAVKQPVSSGEQIALQPTLALMLAQHRVQHAAGRRQKFIVLYCPGVPLTIGDFKDRSQ